MCVTLQHFLTYRPFCCMGKYISNGHFSRARTYVCSLLRHRICLCNTLLHKINVAGLFFGQTAPYANQVLAGGLCPHLILVMLVFMILGYFLILPNLQAVTLHNL